MTKYTLKTDTEDSSTGLTIVHVMSKLTPRAVRESVSRSSNPSRNSSRKSSVSENPSFVQLKPPTPSHAGSDSNRPDSPPKQKAFEFPGSTTMMSTGYSAISVADKIPLAPIDSEQEEQRPANLSTTRSALPVLNGTEVPPGGPSLFSTESTASNVTMQIIPSPQTQLQMHFTASTVAPNIENTEECSCSEHEGTTQVVRDMDADHEDTDGLQAGESHSRSISQSESKSDTNSGLNNLVILDSDIDVDHPQCPPQCPDCPETQQSTTNIIDNSVSSNIQTPTPTPQRPPISVALPHHEEGTGSEELRSPETPETPISEPTMGSRSNSNMPAYYQDYQTALEPQRTSSRPLQMEAVQLSAGREYRLQRSKSPSELAGAKVVEHSTDGQDAERSGNGCRCVVL